MKIYPKLRNAIPIFVYNSRHILVYFTNLAKTYFINMLQFITFLFLQVNFLMKNYGVEKSWSK